MRRQSSMFSNQNADTELKCLEALTGTGLCPRLLGWFEVDNREGFLMEFVEGQTLLERIPALRQESGTGGIPPLFAAMDRLLARLHAFPKIGGLRTIPLSIPREKSFIDPELLDMAKACARAFLDAYSQERNAGFAPDELKAAVIVQVWRIIGLVDESFPEHVLKEWNRRLARALNHDFVSP